MKKERLTEMRAGIFILTTLIGLAVIVFILGSQKGYFKPQIVLKTQFMNVYGLQVGAPVRFMGVRIGYVKAVILPNEVPCRGIEVLLQVDKSSQKNITRDSIAIIKWLSYVTADSYVEITSGACREPLVEDGDTIESAESVDYTAAIESGISAMESFSRIVKKLEERGFVESLNNTLASLDESARAFQRGDGLLYSLVYDPKSKKLLENLTETSESFKKILTEVEKGEGTLGALIADPSLYDNLNRLLGGAERSFILRRLIQKSIERGEISN